jgi:transposase
MEVVMSNTRYTDEFKQEAVRQVIGRGHSVAEVAGRLGTTTHSLYTWIKRFNGPTQQEAPDHATENRRLKAELKRVTEERDILKKAAAYFANESR